MKKILKNKFTLVLLIAIFTVISTLSISFAGIKAEDVFFAQTIKKLPIYSVETAENKLSISFDAAWGADKTREIMNICDSFGVKATFFLVGFWIEKYPDMVKEIYNNGFEIGIHSTTHPDMTKLTRNQMKEELQNNIKLIQDITGFTPKLFRPPYGYYNNDLIDVCNDLNLSCIEWSVDSLDWKGLSASQLSGRVITKATNGSIVLFHNNSDNIIDGLKMVLTHFKSKQMKVVPIGDLIYYNNFSINNQGVQIKN